MRLRSSPGSLSSNRVISASIFIHDADLVDLADAPDRRSRRAITSTCAIRKCNGLFLADCLNDVQYSLTPTSLPRNAVSFQSGTTLPRLDGLAALIDFSAHSTSVPLALAMRQEHGLLFGSDGCTGLLSPGERAWPECCKGSRGWKVALSSSTPPMLLS